MPPHDTTPTPEAAIPSRYKVVGTRPVRPDGVDKVTGRAVYGADVKLPRMAYGKIVRSPHPHARILRIDASEALALPGVLAVCTSADLPDIQGSAHLGEQGEVNMHYMAGNVLARGVVLYEGHAVAAVAAVSQQIANEAALKVKVEYEVLPHVLDVRAAMSPDAPILLPELRTKTGGEVGDTPTNVASHLIAEEGDIEAGFAAAKHIVEREFTCATVHQGYIEPHSSTAEWRADGQLNVWTCTQGAFPVRSQLQQILGHPISQIKVTPTEIGGGFGGKINVYEAPVAALLSRMTGRPVKVTMDRTEVLLGTGPTPAAYMKVKMGVDAEGKITAAQAYLAMEAGAFPGSPVGAGCMTVFAPYKLANVRIDGFDVVVNKPKSAAYRAPAAPQAEFAAEVVVDELARLLGQDPIEFRRLNGAKEGDWRCWAPPFPIVGNLECLDAAENSDHYRTPLVRDAGGGKVRGRGVASGYWFNIGMTSSATARLNPDGTVTLYEGSTDIGGSRASIAMQFAESFGVPYEAVHPYVVDTDSVGFTEVTGGSRTTFATGYAAYLVAQELREVLKKGLAAKWDVPVESISVDGTTYSSGDKSATLKEVASILSEAGALMQHSVTVSPTGSGGAFATHIADVEVDTETGKVEVVRYTAVQDAGTAIHPSYVEGQMQGGVAQGIGYALWEEYFYDAKGHVRNASLLDYRMPTALDVPLIETIIVEIPNPGHPYGVRGVGEVPIIPPLAAISNAIFDAVGVRLYDTPMNPGRVCAAIAATA